MAESTDAVVVGAGVIGSSIALELARSGLRVVVVDKFGGAGNGSTSASSAVVRFTYPTIAGVKAAWESRHCWEAWRDHLQAPAGEPLAAFNRCGVTMLDVDFAPARMFTRHFDKVGVPYEKWGARELSRRLPAVDAGRYFPPRPVDDDEFFADASRRPHPRAQSSADADRRARVSRRRGWPRRRTRWSCAGLASRSWATPRTVRSSSGQPCRASWRRFRRRPAGTT